MKKARTEAAVAAMILAGTADYFVGAALGEGLHGAILFSMIAGIACIVYAIDNQGE